MIISAIAMYLPESIIDIIGFYDIGTAFFLIAIVSLSMKRLMKKLNKRASILRVIR